MDASSLDPAMPLPDDVPTLQTLLRAALVELARMRAENTELREKVEAALKHRFGRRSERRPPADGPRRPVGQPPRPARP
jgi:hypothetical protein